LPFEHYKSLWSESRVLFSQHLIFYFANKATHENIPFFLCTKQTEQTI